MDKKRFAEKTIGAIMGFAVADALGVPAEFVSRDKLRANPIIGMRAGGIHGQPVGTWSDDTSMTLCALDSFTQCGIDYTDLMHRFELWLYKSENTAHHEVFDVGGTCRSAIFKFAKGAPPLECGERADYCCGNGSLMRMLPVALYIAGKYGNADLDARAAELIHNMSACTHAHPRCMMACGIYCAVLLRMFVCDNLEEAVRGGISSALAYYKTQPEFSAVYSDFAGLEHIDALPEEKISGSGYVLHTLQASIWCLLTTKDYGQCVLKAVNLGDDTDTTGAVAGGLAGFWYGESAILEGWRTATAQYDAIRARCVRFAESCFGE